MSQAAHMRFDQLQATNPVYREACNRARAAAAVHCHILLRGQVGTGRRTLAQAVHAESPRREGPFVAAFVTSEERSTPRWVDDQLARARGGTLYLSDPVELSEEAYWRLVHRFTDDVDVRLIASTRREALEFSHDSSILWQGVQDLASEVVVDLPPLRARPEDIVPLFLQFAAEAAPGRVEACTEAAERALVEYAWPGNLLELRLVASQAARAAGGAVVAAGDLPLDGVPRLGEPPMPLHVDRETQVLRRHALGVLRRFGGDMERSAHALGVTLSCLYEKMKRYRIARGEYGGTTPIDRAPHWGREKEA